MSLIFPVVTNFIVTCFAFCFPNLSKNCDQQTLWFVIPVNVMELNHSRGLFRYIFSVTVLRTYCYSFVTFIPVRECKGRELKPHCKIVFKINFQQQLFHFQQPAF